MNSADFTTPADRRGLLRNPNFVLLWCAYGVSALGDHLSELAILKTQDALNTTVDVTPLTARMTFMFFVPFFLLAPIAGALADRVSRRGLMVTADIVRCAILFNFAGLIAWTSQSGRWGAYLPLLPVGVFAALFSPARSALLPTLIRPDQLVRANGLLAGLGIIATMGATLIGGYLAKYYHPQLAFRVDAATFLASAILLLLMRPHPPLQRGGADRRRNNPPEPPLCKGGWGAELGKGFRYARSHRHVRELLVVAAIIWFCGPLVLSAIPAVARDVYHGDYMTISACRAYLGLGFIVGAVIVTVLGDSLRSEIAITWGLFGISVGIAVLALSDFLPLRDTHALGMGATGLILAGVFGLGAMAGFQALLQRTVADRFRGRVFGVNDVCCTGALLVATGMLGLPSGTRVDRWVGLILAAAAAITFVAAIVTLSRRLQRGPHGLALNFCENLNEFIVKFWYRSQRIGRSTVPQTGPVIVTSNHVGPADPMLLSAGAPYRAISFLVAAEYAKWPIVRFFVRTLECIPVHRGTREIAATKQAIQQLERGKAVGIFIEGGIRAPGDPIRLKDGVALLALKTGAVVVPAYISGIAYHERVLRGLFARQHARVRFGPPVDLTEFRVPDPSRETVRAATRRIYEAVLALVPEPQTPKTASGFSENSSLGAGADSETTK